MKGRIRIYVLLICALAAWTITYFQYSSDKQRYLRLKAKGLPAKAESEYNVRMWVDYADYSFTTYNGITIHHSQKIMNKSDFEKHYADLFVIYNPDNPEEFGTIDDLAGYDPAWRRIFYLIINPLAMTFVFFMIIRFIVIMKKRFFPLSPTSSR
jgi:hypothetical protein